MPGKKPSSKEEELLINVKGLYEQLERQTDFNSVNKEFRNTTFNGTFVDCSEFSGKFGATFRYVFATESGDNWSLLSSSEILRKVSEKIPIGTRVEVYKNEKGHWRIIPYLE